jgi:hypothetical protein
MGNSAFTTGSGVLSDATFLTLTDETASVPSSFSIGTLASGLLLNTVTAGTSVVTQATEGTDYYEPGATDVAVADGGTGGSTAGDARTNLGLVIGTDVQAYDAGLLDLAGLAVTDGNFIVGDGLNWVAESGATARTSMGVAIGTDVQAYDATLASLAGLGTAADKFAYTTGVDTWVEGDMDATGRALVADGIVQYANLVGSDVLGPAYNLVIGCNNTSPSATVTSDGATITLTYEASGGGDVTLFFSGGPVTMDTTPAVTATLVAGTDAVPVQNFAYVLKSAPTIITVNQTGFPTTVEYVAIGEFLCPTAATVQTFGLYAGHVWTNEMWKDTTRNGHLYEIGKWIRSQPATWISGTAVTPTLTPGAPDTLTFAVSAGQSFQFHEHSFPAFNSATGGSTNLTTFFVVNDNAGAYNQGKDLYNFKFDSLGNAATNNDRISWVIWAVVSEETGDCKIMVNLPGGFYANDSDAISDPSRYSNYTIPTGYQGTAFLLAKLTYQYQTSGGGTLTLVEQVDLRGSLPNIFAGGSSGGGANVALDNLSGVSINTSLISDTDATDDLGSVAIAWNNIYGITGLLTTIELGHATDTTLSRASAGNVNIEGNIIYRAGGTDVPLADGGTNASLTADNGGIFYSTATAGAILASTATANQMLQSGSSAAPAWSTATYPATTTANQLLYSSATNTVGGLATGNDGVLITSAAGVPSISTAIPNGVTATTQSASDNSTKLATTAYVDAAAGGGGMVLIASASAAADATIDFDDSLDSTYDAYFFVVTNYVPAADSRILYMRFGTGTGPPTYQASLYSRSAVYSANGGSVTSDGSASDGEVYLTSGSVGAQTGESGNVTGYIYGPSSGTLYTQVNASGSFMNGSAAVVTWTAAGVWKSATAVTSVRFLASTGNIATGEFYLYGIPKS